MPSTCLQLPAPCAWIASYLFSYTHAHTYSHPGTRTHQRVHTYLYTHSSLTPSSFSLFLLVATSCLFYPVDKKMPAIRLSTRRKSELVGQVRKGQHIYSPSLLSSCFYTPILRSLSHTFSHSKHTHSLSLFFSNTHTHTYTHSQRLLVSVDRWPADSLSPLGHYVRVLGKDGQKDVETQVTHSAPDCIDCDHLLFPPPCPTTPPPLPSSPPFPPPHPTPSTNSLPGPPSPPNPTPPSLCRGW